MTTTILAPMLAWEIPSFTLVVIAFFGATLPVAFFLWMNWWLGSVKDENPDKVIADQAKADAEHAKHSGHGHGGDHHAAHA